MRCRFCSKSIPLLRRLSDTQFCSDAHRDAYSDEQKLAFERLMTTQAVGKTQRMPAYSQAAEIPQGRPQTQTMVAAGEFQPYYLDTPLPFGNHTGAGEPIATNLTVFFCEHTVAFPARFRRAGRLARVSVRAGSGNRKPLVEGGFASECRPGLPKASTRPIRWEYKVPIVDTDPELITRLWPVVSAPRQMVVRAARSELLWLAHADYRTPELATPVPAPRLRPVRSLFAVAAPPDLPMAEELGWPLELLPTWAFLLSYPSGQSLRAIAETIPLIPSPSPSEEINALFEAFADQPLAGSRHLPALAAAILRFGSPVTPSMLPLAVTLSPLPAHSTDLAGIAALPQVLRAFPLLPVEAATPKRMAAEKAIALPITGMGPMTPRRKTAAEALTLSRRAGLQLLRPMAGARAEARPVAAAEIGPSWTPAIPSPAMQGGLRLPVAGITLYSANIRAVRSVASGWIPETVLPAPAPVIPSLPSIHRLPVQARGNAIAVAHPAARQILPDSVVCESLAPIFTPVTPALRLASLRGGHTDGHTRCFAVAPPRSNAAHWTVPPSDWAMEPEIVLSPRHRRAVGDCFLQRPSNALYRIPNAQPLPKACTAAPAVFPMSDWGPKPLMRPANLRASDGTDFAENSSVGWRSALRERFANFGTIPSFGRLRRLPPDIKWIAMAVPLIIGIWVVARPEGKASSAPVQVSGGVPQAEVEPVPAPPVAEETQASAAAEPEPPGLKKQKEAGPAAPKAAEPSRWDILQTKISDRAAIDIVEDFRSGLSRWDGKGNWARTWSYDRSGTVRPGNMAVFEPTTGLRDYSFEMKAAVDKRVIQWLVRATDLSNYHINRLIVTPDAAQTKLELQRWTVYKGRAERVKLVLLPHGPANQSLFSVRVDVRGDSVTTYLGDQVIDTFSDSRLASGGIGLAGAPGDQARVYAVRISHQTDFLGKLCSFLAPQPMNMKGTE